jgi:hypothetical protein
MKRKPFLIVAWVSTILLASTSALAQLNAGERKCSDAFNSALRNVGNQEQKSNRKDCVRAGLGDACVDNISPGAFEKGLKVVALFDPSGKCDPNAAFGVVNSGAPAGSDAATAIAEGADDVIRDIFGDPVSGIVTGDKCQDAVAKRSGKIYDTMLKSFRKCAKGLASIDTIADLDGCVQTASVDPKVMNVAAKLTDDVVGKCAATPPIVAGTEAGECSGAGSPGDFSDCVLARTRCNACLAINAATDGNADCAAISGTPCGFSAHKCTFDETVDNSNLSVFVGGNTNLSSLVQDIAGAIDIACAGTPDVNGKRDCTCTLQTWTPIQITGIGFICIEPGPTCPTGEVDCDGGNVLGIEAEDFSQLDNGAIPPPQCASHAACSSLCDTHCAGLGKIRYASGCENLCQGGSRDGLACICDTAGASGCVGGMAGVNDCPGGSCVGKNNEADTDCQCQCIDYAYGGASSAGDLLCNLSLDIKVVASLPCSNPALIDPTPICAPFSSQSVTGTTTVANEGTGGGPIGPNTLIGTAESCTNLDASITTGFTLVGDLGFFDTDIGDIRAPITLDCQ